MHRKTTKTECLSNKHIKCYTRRQNRKGYFAFVVYFPIVPFRRQLCFLVIIKMSEISVQQNEVKFTKLMCVFFFLLLLSKMNILVADLGCAYQITGYFAHWSVAYCVRCNASYQQRVDYQTYIALSLFIEFKLFRRMLYIMISMNTFIVVFPIYVDNNLRSHFRL